MQDNYKKSLKLGDKEPANQIQPSGQSWKKISSSSKNQSSKFQQKVKSPRVESVLKQDPWKDSSVVLAQNRVLGIVQEVPESQKNSQSFKKSENYHGISQLMDTGEQKFQNINLQSRQSQKSEKSKKSAPIVLKSVFCSF